MKKKPNKTKLTKPKTRTFRPAADLLPMLEAAEKAGIEFTELVNRAVKQQGPAVLREIAAEMRAKAKSIDALADGQNTSGGKS